MRGKTDKIFIFFLTAIVLMGILVFASASLGIFAKNEALFYSIITNQFLFGLMGGILAFFISSKINYHVWKKYALPIFILAIVTTTLVFVPTIGFESGGAKRWIHVLSFSFQPSEFLKFGLVAYLAAFFSLPKESRPLLFKTISLFIFLAITAVIMLKQPDTTTFVIMAAAALSIYIASGAKWKHVFAIFAAGLIGFALLVSFRPYVKERLMTFLDSTRDPQGSSYQIQQSLIAIGSGELFGRGLGQSVQKFNFLPEPIGDSIFAIIGEELGFVGGTVIVLLFLLFGLRGLKIASHAKDSFGAYLAVGIITLIIAQSFINIASLIGIFPLAGVPLVFVSHGGTALLFALAEVGIVANISRKG